MAQPDLPDQPGRGTPPAALPGDRTPLTRRLILATALALIDADGVESLSMRHLGTLLQRDPMAVYRYAATKADLLDGVVELVLEDLVVDADAPDWTVELRRSAQVLRSIALAHPHVVPLLVTHLLETPLGMRKPTLLRPLESFLTLLTRTGLSPPAALRWYRVFFAIANGHLLDEMREVVAEPDEDDTLLRLGLHHLPVREFPLVRSLADELLAYDGAAQLELEVGLIIDGVRRELAALPDRPETG